MRKVKPNPLNPERFFIRSKTKRMNNNKHIAVASPPSPPFWGAKVIDLPLARLFDHLNLPALYRIGWGAGRASGEKWARYQADFSTRLSKMKQSFLNDKSLLPQAAYGYWQCASEDGAILIFPDPERKDSNTLRLPVPRQAFPPYRSLSDYFLPQGDHQGDVIAFQVVTMGTAAIEYIQYLKQQQDTVEVFFAHGLLTQLTEAAAVATLATIREELSIDSVRGKRYSWGYEPIPDLSQQVSIMRLLDPPNNLRIFFTSAYQFIPEYTTAALFIHHPEAAYFRITQEEPYDQE